MTTKTSSEKKNILIIDDERDILEAVSTFLTEANFHVKTAQNIFLAENLLAKENFDLVITDLRLPTIVDGIQIISKIKKRIYTKHIPIIVLSGNIDQANLTALIQLGIKDIVTKPIDPQELLSRITNLITKNQNTN